MADGAQRIVRMAELEVDPDRIDVYRALLAEEIEASLRLEPGVLMLCAVADRQRPHCIRIVEIYADRAAYEAHLATPHFLKYRTGTAAMVRSLHLADCDPVAIGVKAQAFAG